MKKVLSLVLCLVMLTATLTACSKNEKKSNETTKPNVSDTSSTDTSGEETSSNIDISKPVTLKMYFNGSNITDDSAVLAAANEYLGEKLNVTLEPIWGTWGDFDDKVTLAINGGDDIDIYFTCSWSADEYNAFARKGAWVRLDDPDNNLIDQYATELWDLLPDVLTEGATVTGADGVGVYAVPGYKDIATQNCWDINVDLLEKYNYTIEDIKNADYFSFGEILETVKQGEGDDFYPLMIEGAVAERMVTNSIIVTGDSGTTNLMSYYIDPTDTAAEGAYGNVILNKFATDEYKAYVEQTREYYLAGYIDPAMGNATQANDVRTAKQLSGEYLIGTQSYSLGYETQASQERGFHVEMVPVTPAYVDTTSSQGALMAISTASKNPERAMMLLNLLNTDSYLMTLLNYGIEGVHYDLVDGEAVFTAERDNYIPWTNGMGNVTLLPAQEGQGADFYETFIDYYGSASEIPILGYAFDATSVSNELAALANAAEEYALPLSAGTIDPADKLDEFLAKLEANGIDKIIDEANAQLTEFLEAKGE